MNVFGAFEVKVFLGKKHLLLSTCGVFFSPVLHEL